MRKTNLSIIWDARFANGPVNGGQAMYLQSIFSSLEKIHPEIGHDLMVPKLAELRWVPRQSNFIYYEVPNLPHRIRKILGIRDIWWRWLVPITKRYRFRKDSIVVSAINVGPQKGIQCPYVAVAHDLDYIEFPDLYEASHRRQNTLNTNASVESAAHIIAISAATKDQILKYYSIDENKISIVHHGYNREEFHTNYTPQETDDIKRKLGLPEKFMLAIGSLSPKKNIKLLLDVICLLKKNYDQHIPLVLGGGWKREAEETVKNMIKDKGVVDDVLLPGYIKDEDMGRLYSAADLFLFPSFAEGFGLPLVEAMACGCPVLCSNASCMPEVVADAAVKLDPHDASAWAKEVDFLLTNLKARELFKEKGIKRVKVFSWDKAAQETIDILLQVGGR